MLGGAQFLGLLRADASSRFEHIADGVQRQHRLEAKTLVFQSFLGAGVITAAMVEKHHHILHAQAGVFEFGDSFQHAAPGDQDVVDHRNGFSFVELTFHESPGAMGFHFLAWVDQRFVQLQ